MVGTVNAERTARALEFGIYRDGDNNLDVAQSATIAQALRVSDHDSAIEFSVEDTTARRGFFPAHVLRTETYAIADGDIGNVHVDEAHDMADRDNLAAFVAHTLDAAERSHARQTWIDLVDHGGGDGGGLEADHGSGIMGADDMAAAVADGEALHARAHPEDAGRRVDGVVANQCLMATESFSYALSRAGVRWLAASPETMIAPGVPTTIAADIAHHEGNAVAMARAVVHRAMGTRYETPDGERFGPAAAFDLIDLAPQKMAAMKSAVASLDGEVTRDARMPGVRAAIRDDARGVTGMVRFTHQGLPWRADRPAVALYDALAADDRLPDALRTDAAVASSAVSATILAHGESDGFEPFGGADYRDAVGPTVHFPVTRGQIDAWAPEIRETDNAFYRAVGGDRVARAIA